MAETNERTAPLILIVEDNPDNLLVYTTILEHFGFHTIQTANGEYGVRLAREARPDLILMDMSIPGIDGSEAGRRIRTDALTREIALVAITPHALASDRHRLEALGFDGYLAKPVEPRRILLEVCRFFGTDRVADQTFAPG